MSLSSQSRSFDNSGPTLDALVDGFTALVKQVFDLPQQLRKADIHQIRQADEFGRGLEITEWISHPRTLRDVLPALKNFALTMPSEWVVTIVGIRSYIHTMRIRQAILADLDAVKSCAKEAYAKYVPRIGKNRRR